MSRSGKRIAIAGFLHESNTFLGSYTSYEDFAATSLTRGAALIERWRGTRHELGGMLDAVANLSWEPAPLLATYAVPGGTLEQAAFERIASELLAEIERALPFDGLLLALHGATVASGFPDADGEMLRRLRERLGSGFPIVTTLDLHANISDAMEREADALVAYRTNPHVDQFERGWEAAHLMARILDQGLRPAMAVERPPMLIEIACQHTAAAPAWFLYQDLEGVLAWPGVITASVAMGFYYADVEEMGVSFAAVTDGDHAAALKAARWMAGRAWQRRNEFKAALLSIADAVRRAALADRTPVALMDAGDNVGGGAPGDSTAIFAEVLRQGVPDSLVILHDPAAVALCQEAGVRRMVELDAGGKATGNPLRISGRVRTLSDGIFVETEVRHGGWTHNDQGLTAVVETSEGHSVILTSRRMAPMSLEQVLSLGIRPGRKRILIVKGVIAPRAAYEPVAAEILLVDTPGATSNNPRDFDYRRRRRPLYPLEEDAPYINSRV